MNDHHLSGVCRVCGCTAERGCTLGDGEVCCWVDAAQTLCSACVVTPAGDPLEQHRLHIELRARHWRLLADFCEEAGFACVDHLVADLLTRMCEETEADREVTIDTRREAEERRNTDIP